jgi:hypothetical protein
MERIAWNQHANKGLQRKLKVEKTCSLLVTLKGMSVLSVQKSTGTWRLSAECDTVFCHSARQTTTTQKLHREWRLTDGNKKSYEITSVKPSPIRHGFECNLHFNPCINQYFSIVFF